MSKFGNSFKDLSKYQLRSLFEELISLSKESCTHWIQTGIVKNRYSILEMYDEFPPKSKFTKPKAVPVQARWGRIRINQNLRLAGFLLPEVNNVKNLNNIFYVVFYDEGHNFYPMRKR